METELGSTGPSLLRKNGREIKAFRRGSYRTKPERPAILTRAPAFEAAGRGFESLRALQCFQGFPKLAAMAVTRFCSQTVANAADCLWLTLMRRKASRVNQATRSPWPSRHLED